MGASLAALLVGRTVARAGPSAWILSDFHLYGVLVTHAGSFPLDSKVQSMSEMGWPGLEEAPANIADGESQRITFHEEGLWTMLLCSVNENIFISGIKGGNRCYSHFDRVAPNVAPVLVFGGTFLTEHPWRLVG